MSRTVLGLLAVVVLIAIVLFATGFWSADVEEGALPTVSIDGGAMPDVDLDSKEVVVGTTTETIEVPTVETTTETVEVPVIGVKEDGEQ